MYRLCLQVRMSDSDDRLADSTLNTVGSRRRRLYGQRRGRCYAVEGLRTYRHKEDDRYRDVQAGRSGSTVRLTAKKSPRCRLVNVADRTRISGWTRSIELDYRYLQRTLRQVSLATYLGGIVKARLVRDLPYEAMDILRADGWSDQVVGIPYQGFPTKII